MTTTKTAITALKLACIAAIAVSLSGCLIVVADGDDDFHHGHHNDAPAATSFRIEADTRAPSKGVSVLGPTLTFRGGELSSDEDLVIEGTVEGKIAHQSHHLTIGKSGRVTGPHLHFEFRRRTQEGWIVMDAGTVLEQALAQLIQGPIAQAKPGFTVPVLFQNSGKFLKHVRVQQANVPPSRSNLNSDG